MNKIMKKCREMDITLSEAIGEVTLPKGKYFNIEEGLKCYQSDEGSKKVSDVGHMPEDQCGIIWNITRYDIKRKPLLKQPPVIKGDQHLQSPRQMANRAYMSTLWYESVFKSQDRVAADQFWICRNKILRPTLAKMWRGRCAEIAILPPLNYAVGNLESTNLKRRKRAYEQDENIKIDKIGQPTGIPEKFRARSEITAELAALLPAIEMLKMRDGSTTFITINKGLLTTRMMLYAL